MRTAAILPVKSFPRAKQRLGASVPDELRLALARAMVEDVLAALAVTRGLERTFVVTRQHDVAASAAQSGATVLQDPDERGQSAAAALGAAHALSGGYERVLCVPGDCPALDPGELEDLLARRRSRELVILPDRHGTGTNGLLLAPPDVIEPSFGPGSCARHRRLADAAGVHCDVHSLGSLSLDIDTGADLAALRARLPEREGLAVRTRSVLSAERFAAALPVAGGA